ncbi:hypothetical protein [Kribbella sp. NPDC004536]|uniref:hypothetical protein n=1 Tax=Kribbella sp. NPDC004536 TaxID=3364106 RepID=UPI0036AF299B
MMPHARPTQYTRRRVLQFTGAGLALAAVPTLSATAAEPTADGNTLTVPALPSARTTELDRTQDSLSASELRTTGFYLPAGTALNVVVHAT